MDNIVTITLGRGRTKQQAFSDAALVGGWTSKVEVSGSSTETCTYQELQDAGTPEAILTQSGISFTRVTSVSNNQNAQPDDVVTISYDYVEEVDNPITEQEFGARVWAQVCDERDRATAVKAAEMRDLAAEDYEASVVA